MLEEIQIWIEHLKMNKRVEELSLVGLQSIFFDKPFSPPKPVSFFQGRTLRKLELQSLKISDASLFEGCSNLKTLMLDSVSLSNETLVKIIFNCIFLENLVLIGCKKLVNFKIQDKRLKYLEVKNLYLDKFDLCAENLSFLSLSNVSCSSQRIFIECPNLNEFRFYSTSYTHSKMTSQFTTSEFLARFSGLLAKQGMELQNFNCYNLRVLRTSFDLNSMDHIIILRFILRVWTNLQSLHIINEVSTRISDDHLPCVPYPEYMFWEGHLVDSITHHLKVVHIKGFTGKEREMTFVLHLIRNATRLEKLVIEFDNACPKLEEDAKRKLLLVPKASFNASIILN
ncbi:hypothetical protein ACH5RR_028220 [Cinchona calisaya]|uniref:FBD domain-containing protein n=1 Tax=Cinchona calisaya TaxID=153742 RepID=A0ABD2YQ39_9GENT